jgi:hypothetical protein
VVVFRKPPPAVQRLVFAALTPIATRRGYRGTYPQSLAHRPRVPRRLSYKCRAPASCCGRTPTAGRRRGPFFAYSRPQAATGAILCAGSRAPCAHLTARNLYATASAQSGSPACSPRKTGRERKQDWPRARVAVFLLPGAPPQRRGHARNRGRRSRRQAATGSCGRPQRELVGIPTGASSMRESGSAALAIPIEADRS